MMCICRPLAVCVHPKTFDCENLIIGEDELCDELMDELHAGEEAFAC